MLPEASNQNSHTEAKPPIRYHRAARTSVVLLICAAAVLVMTNLQLPDDSIFSTALQNSGHFVIFCLLTLFSLALLRGILSLPSWILNCLLISGLMVVGFSIELIQKFIGRGFSISDQLLNLGGIVCGILIYHGVRSLVQRRYTKALLCGLAALILLLAGFYKPIQIAINFLQQPRAPMLANFEEPNSLLRFFHFGTGSLTVTDAPAEWPENNSRVLQAQTGKRNRVRIQLREPHPDWTGYDWLDFDVFLANGKKGTILLMLRDRSNWRNENGIDAYLRFIKITPGLNTISVPLDLINKQIGQTVDNTTQNQELDLKQMEEVVFLLLASGEARTVFLDNVTLR